MTKTTASALVAQPLSQCPCIVRYSNYRHTSSRQRLDPQFTCVGWQVTLCDPIWQVTSRSCEMEFH